jgi:hypothetical protein
MSERNRLTRVPSHKSRCEAIALCIRPDVLGEVGGLAQPRWRRRNVPDSKLDVYRELLVRRSGVDRSSAAGDATPGSGLHSCPTVRVRCCRRGVPWR